MLLMIGMLAWCLPLGGLCLSPRRSADQMLVLERDDSQALE